jgi:hypothetical protein
MPYQLDLSAITIAAYKELLKNQRLLPGRRLLGQEMDAHFAAITGQGGADVARLKKRLSSPAKLTAFAAATGIPEPYWTLLKREIGSLEQKPVPIASFPDLDAATVADVSARGLRNSKEGYESDLPRTGELFCLCDLVRINGVGAVAAKAFYEADYRSVADVAAAEAVTMLQRVTMVNERKGYYQAKLGEKDMQFCIDFASLLVKYGG